MVDLNPDPQSTWGASDEYKAAWHEKYGVNRPSDNASKQEWADYAEKVGVEVGDYDSTTKAEIQEAVDSASEAGIVEAPSQVGIADKGTPRS